MKVKHRIILLGATAAALIGTFFALRAFLPDKTEKFALNTPENVRLEGHTLRWEPVPYAVRYEVEIGGEARATTAAHLSLKYADDGKTVRVRALGNGAKPSAFSEVFTMYYSPTTLNDVNIVTYRLAERGVDRKEFIDTGVPVSIDAQDYTEYGYEFRYWYEWKDGVETPVTEARNYWNSVVLYAKVRPIEYRLTVAVPQGFSFGEEFPGTYTVETLGTLAGVTAERDGLRVEGWSFDADGRDVLTSSSVRTGDLTIYPRISPISEGLSFEKTDGGYALTAYAGEAETVYVPAYYEGEPVVEVRSGAFVGSAAGRLKKIVFYGSVLLRYAAIDACAELENVVCTGDLTAEDKAVFIPGDALRPQAVFTVEIYGAPPEKDAFIAGYLGEPPGKRVVVKVAGGYYEACLAAYDTADVERMEA